MWKSRTSNTSLTNNAQTFLSINTFPNMYDVSLIVTLIGIGSTLVSNINFNSFYVKKIIRELNKINIKAIPAFISFNKFKYLKIYYNKNNNKSDFKNSELLQNSLVVLPLNLKLTKNDIIFINHDCSEING